MGDSSMFRLASKHHRVATAVALHPRWGQRSFVTTRRTFSADNKESGNNEAENASDASSAQRPEVLTKPPPESNAETPVERVEKEKSSPPPPHATNGNGVAREWFHVGLGALGAVLMTAMYYSLPKNEEPNPEKLPPFEPVEYPEEEGNEELPGARPPAHPMMVADSFPYLAEETMELERTFCYAGTFVICMGPREFNRYDLINDYLSDNRHAVKFQVHPAAYTSPLVQYREPGKGGAIRELLMKSINDTIDFGLLPLLEHVGGDVLEQMTQLIEQRGPSADQFVWVNSFEVILNYIDSIEDPEEKAQEQADLRCFLLWLVEMSIYNDWCQVIIQSTDPFLINRLEPYLLVRTDPQIRKISFGERSADAMERRLKRLLDMNDVSLPAEDITKLTRSVGGSAPLLEHAVKLLLGGKTVEDIIEIQLQPAIVGLERLLLESPHRLLLWEMMQLLVDNYEKTGLLFIPDRIVSYSPSSRALMEQAREELGDYLFFYEIPTGHMMEQQARVQDERAPIHSGYISTTSVRAMTSCVRLIRDPDMQKVMWNEKKQSKAEPIRFHV